MWAQSDCALRIVEHTIIQYCINRLYINSVNMLLKMIDCLNKYTINLINYPRSIEARNVKLFLPIEQLQHIVVPQNNWEL